MFDLKRLIENKGACDRLLFELNRIATDFSPYEYGLPTNSAGELALMREAIYSWAASLPTSKEVTP